MKYEIYRFETLPSTQEFLRKKQGEGRDMLAVAARQTQGKGTKNRSFECAEGGLWFSLLRFHENALAADAFLMMAKAAVAVAKTLEEYGLVPKIKWANDVLVGGKKICGILTENRLCARSLVSTLWGIGLNVNNPLPNELVPIATGLSKELGRECALSAVEEKLLSHLDGEFCFSEYVERLAYLGEEVPFEMQGQTFTARLEGVTERGELVLSKGGVSARYAYGEITVLKNKKDEIRIDE